jgi:hypothetical protein
MAMITHSHNLTHEWKQAQIFASLQSSMKSSIVCTHHLSSLKIGDDKNMGASV